MKLNARLRDAPRCRGRILSMLRETDRPQEKRGLAQAKRSGDVPVPAFP